MPPGVGNGWKRGGVVYYESLNLWLLLYSESVLVSSLFGGGNVDGPSEFVFLLHTVALEIN